MARLAKYEELIADAEHALELGDTDKALALYESAEPYAPAKPLFRQQAEDPSVE